MVRTESSLLIGAHAYGGVDFYHEAKTDIDFAKYTYNTTGSDNALTFSGIHIAGSASGDPRYPTGHTNTGPGDPDPTTLPWGFSGTFKIGTIGDPDVYDYTDPLNPVLIFKGNQPATIDVGTDSSNNTSLFLSQPMSGTIRVADVNFGGQGFGPIILDNIQVHRLNVKISP
jgi:hypothetical protein